MAVGVLVFAMFGRPAYFFGGDHLPGSTKASSVVDGETVSTAAAAASSSVALGEDESIVGACWNGETHLLVTSAHSVRVFHVEHLHMPLRTWNFRPDEEHLLTSSAVIVGQAFFNVIVIIGQGVEPQHCSNTELAHGHCVEAQ